MPVIQLSLNKTKDYLNGFVLSFAKLFDFTRFFNPPEVEYSNQTDVEILRNDWEILNKDMWISVNKVKSETAVSTPTQ